MRGWGDSGPGFSQGGAEQARISFRRPAIDPAGDGLDFLLAQGGVRS
jgi:hypothetical protein